jgi:energy-coupling factor transporter ATP-binding protein EcfA2
MAENKVTVIGIAGGTGCGKTTVVKRLVEALPPHFVAVVPLDSYYNDTTNMTEEERRAINFDHPDAFDWKLLHQQLADLRPGTGTDAKCIHCLADVHSLGNTDYGRSNPNGYSGICCQDGQSGYRILADAYTPAAVGSVHPLQPIIHCLSSITRYRMGNAGIWCSRSRQCPEGFQQPTQMA